MPINLDNVTNIMLGNTPVEQVTDSLGNVLWSAAPAPEYFFVENASSNDNTLSITKNNDSAPTIEVFCSTDQQNWSSMGSTSTTAITATVPANSKLYLKATANAWCTISYYNTINTTGNCNVGGNIMSLLYDDNFASQTTLSTDYTFSYLFNNSTNIVSAENLILPATTLANNCYRQMFEDCSSLTTAPALPATTLIDGCYYDMFKGCTALTTAPVLPATTLADGCYESMFYGCTSLTTAPELPATTLVYACYENMFRECTALTTAPVLPATTLASSCYRQMFNGCTALTTAPALPATELANSCYNQMFSACRALTTAPVLPATVLASSCYRQMFSGCTRLTTTPVLPATTLASSCYREMFRGCGRLNSVTTYAQDISANSCLNNWLYGVSATGDFYNLGGATYPSGVNGIPTGWTEHTSL